MRVVELPGRVATVGEEAAGPDWFVDAEAGLDSGVGSGGAASAGGEPAPKSLQPLEVCRSFGVETALSRDPSEMDFLLLPVVLLLPLPLALPLPGGGDDELMAPLKSVRGGDSTIWSWWRGRCRRGSSSSSTKRLRASWSDEEWLCRTKRTPLGDWGGEVEFAKCTAASDVDGLPA